MKVSQLVAQLLLMPQDADVALTGNPYAPRSDLMTARPEEVPDTSLHLLEGFTPDELRTEQYEALLFERQNFVVVALSRSASGKDF